MNSDDVREAILNHTALRLAGLAGAERREAATVRRHYLTGMLELARRLEVPAELLAFLEQHREYLAQEIERLSGAWPGP
ncbi:MAG: hypothetical protein FIA97_06425 [Methylococcaceae bacterium]|nr:hypothetical protein [Methylococcaceae bacterium]